MLNGSSLLGGYKFKMAVRDFYSAAADELAAAGDLIIDGSGTTTGAVEIHSIGHSGSCEVYLETDPAGTGTWTTSILVDSFTGAGYSQQNKIEVNGTDAMRLRVTNTSGGPADFIVTGEEVFA